MQRLIILIVVLSVLNGCHQKTTSHQQEDVSKPAAGAKSSPADSLPVDSLQQMAAENPIDEDHINKADIFRKDSSVTLQAFMRMDHRIFGYERADTNSRKMILLSIFTFDVKDNPYHCPFGAYYQTNDMGDSLSLKYAGDANGFVQVQIFKRDSLATTVFMEKRWVTFTD